MRKRGYSLSVIFSSLVGLVILAVIIVSFSGVGELTERQGSVEVQNFKNTLATKILQQSSRQSGSEQHVSLSAPSSAAKLCFFDAEIPFDALRNPEIVGLYGDDLQHNAFLLTDNGFFAYELEKLQVQEEKNPLCIHPIDSRFEFTLHSLEGNTVARANASSEDVSCVSVLENGDPQSKIDLVFLGFGFASSFDFGQQVNRYINNILFEFEPFVSHKDKFNAYRIDDASLDCSVDGFIKCDNHQIKRVASDCPHDQIIVLVSRSALKDFISPVRSSAIGNIMKINTADNPFVFVHEFGHTFGDLADEYVDENYYSETIFDVTAYPNCDSAPCVSWSGTENTSCFEGCSLNRYFRPTKTSIMRSLSSSDYGPVNKEELLKRLLHYE